MHMTAKLYKLAGVFNNTSGLYNSSTARGHFFFALFCFLFCFFFWLDISEETEKQKCFSARTVNILNVYMVRQTEWQCHLKTAVISLN